MEIVFQGRVIEIDVPTDPGLELKGWVFDGEREREIVPTGETLPVWAVKE